MKIIINGAKCLLCNDIIYSKHTHDLNRCKCGAVMVDGGRDYIRRAGDSKNYQDVSIYESKFDKGGECADMFIIYSPQGMSNPGICFSSKDEAAEAAVSLKEKFGGTWYVAELVTPV